MTQVETVAGGNSNLSEVVVEAVAEAEGIDPLEITPPLYDVINPDALDHLFTPTPTDGRMNGRVTFFYNGYEVTVCGDGYISVEAREECTQCR